MALYILAPTVTFFILRLLDFSLIEKWSQLALLLEGSAAAARQLLAGGIWRNIDLLFNRKKDVCLDLKGKLKNRECIILHFRLCWNSLLSAS